MKEEVLSVNVQEEIGSQDGMPGSFKEEKLPVLMRYVKWSGKITRFVTDSDIPRLIQEAKVLAELCHTRTGAYMGANAVAHNQIDSEDPLRFFVASSGEIIVNPVIVEHTKTPVTADEACTSFAELPPKSVKRYNVVTVRFQQITPTEKLSEVIEERFSGKEARVMQHEVEHLNGHCIHDPAHSPDWCVGTPILTVE